jgi:SAM-dependent methyltransferase
MFEYLRKPWRVNSSRRYLAEFAQRAAASVPEGSCVLDAGAGDTPYRAFFKLTHYDATDLHKVEKSYGKLSYICNLNKIPIRSEYYDLVFCSQTLEHVPDPSTVIAEVVRVLKPGGQLWLTVPFYYEEHETPFDYYRYTQFGLSYMITKAGINLVSTEWLEGYFWTFAYQLKLASTALPLSPRELGPGIWGWLLALPVGCVKLFCAIFSLFFTWLDMRTKYISSGHCKNYALVAIKPLKSESQTF